MEKIKIYFKKRFKVWHSDSCSDDVHPQRDWEILILVFIIAVIFAIAYDYDLYNDISTGEMFVSAESDGVAFEKLNTSGLNKVIDTFEIKDAAYNELKKTSLVDPAI